MDNQTIELIKAFAPISQDLSKLIMALYGAHCTHEIIMKVIQRITIKFGGD